MGRGVYPKNSNIEDVLSNDQIVQFFFKELIEKLPITLC